MHTYSMQIKNKSTMIRTNQTALQFTLFFLLILISALTNINVNNVIASSVLPNTCEDSTDNSCTDGGALQSYDPYAPITPDRIIDDAYTNRNEHRVQNRIKHMWTTPVLISSLVYNNMDTVSIIEFNKALSEKAMNTWQKFVTTKKPNSPASLSSSSASASSSESLLRGDSSSGLNEQFFAWQQDQHALPQSQQESLYRELTQNKEFKSLLHLMDHYFQTFLLNIGKDEQWIVNHYDIKKLFCWCTISSEGNYHLSHTHPGHSLSGVYYSRIPIGSGSIIFDDPRGPRMPFDGRIVHHPLPGEILIFPSWLVHQVTNTQTQSGEERVSWSCNAPGKWEDTTDINLA